MKRTLVAFLLCACPLSAIAQQDSSGSIGIASWSDDEITIAADSRQTTGNRYSDTSCKISAFGNKLVFVATGRSKIGIDPTWDGYAASGVQYCRLASKGTTNRLAYALATMWGEDVKKEFERYGTLAIAGLDDQHVMTGFFADFERDGTLLMVVEEVTYEILPQGIVIKAHSTIYPTSPGHISYLGHPAVVIEEQAGKTLQAIAWQDAIHARKRVAKDPVAEEAISLVELTIANLPKDKVDANGIPFSVVGKPVAALRLTRSNGVEWLAQGKCSP
jgi:hypothetical protein